MLVMDEISKPDSDDWSQIVSRLQRCRSPGRPVKVTSIKVEGSGRLTVADKEPVSMNDDPPLPRNFMCTGKHGKYQDQGVCCDSCEARGLPSIPVQATTMKTRQTVTINVTDAWLLARLGKKGFNNE